jgi:hypothetical protein
LGRLVSQGIRTVWAVCRCDCGCGWRGVDPVTDWLVNEALLVAFECAESAAVEDAARQQRNAVRVAEALDRIRR